MLFVLVDPIERMIAQYEELKASLYYEHSDRDSNPNTSFTSNFTFDDVVVAAMQYKSLFSEVREMVTNGTSLDFIVHFYYQQLSVDMEEYTARTFLHDRSMGNFGQSKNDLNRYMSLSYSLFANSLYFPAIMHYVNVLGQQNVRIIFKRENSICGIASTNQSNLLHEEASDMKDLANEVFQYMNLCPHELTKQSKSDDSILYFDGNSENSSDPRPIQLEISQDTFRKLTVYFLPFQELLANITHIYNISEGEVPPFPSLLLSEEAEHLMPPYSEGLNDSRPLLWFEERTNEREESLPTIGRLVPKLIPQRLRKKLLLLFYFTNSSIAHAQIYC